MAVHIVDAALRLDFGDDQIVSFYDRTNDVLRREYIAKKRIRHRIGENRHVIVCFSQFLLRKTRIDAFSGSLCHCRYLLVTFSVVRTKELSHEKRGR